MRDYLYIWHDPAQQVVVASGVEFKDLFAPLSTQGGVLLIDHGSETAELDLQSGFDHASTAKLPALMAENIYSWGNFAWADYAAPLVPPMTDDELAELLFFAHRGRPLHRIALPSLRNNFLGYAHDDGWFLQLYYTNWQHVERFVNSAIPPTLGSLNASELKMGNHAFWLRDGETRQEKRTHDIDSILNRCL